MALSDEKLDTIISLLEESNRLREENLQLAKDASRKTDDIIVMNKEIHESYKKHAIPMLKLAIPMTIFIVVVILLCLYALFGILGGFLF